MNKELLSYAVSSMMLNSYREQISSTIDSVEEVEDENLDMVLVPSLCQGYKPLFEELISNLPLADEEKDFFLSKEGHNLLILRFYEKSDALGLKMVNFYGTSWHESIDQKTGERKCLSE